VAGRITIVEAEYIVEAGEFDPNEVHLPGVYVDKVILAVDNEKPIERMRVQDAKGGQVVRGGRGRIMRRAAKEFKDGMYVNLGIGIPTMVRREHFELACANKEMHTFCSNPAEIFAPCVV
jgi:3-oxoacid CoA-transferase